MSEAPDTSARDIEARAADWLMERQDRENWSAEDQESLDVWMMQSPAHEVAFLRLEAAWGRTDRLAALRRPDDARPVFPFLLRIAAAIAIVAALVAGGANVFSRPGERTFSTPVGGHESVAFADGSRVELNTNTVLRARMTTQERVVWLDRGEAFFQIKHDAAHPFVVMVGDRRITDLGTAFSVRSEASKLRVAVVQGRVWFDPADKQVPAQSAMLNPGDVATVVADKMSVTKEPTRALAAGLSWRRGVLVFENTALADAAAELNRYNREKLVIADPAIASETIGGTFGTKDIETFARVARTALGLRVANNGAEIIIFR
ncbi:MAG TPA: FecR domain-containing protein [Rhizomicrobium sp.]|nr:FecR domain-containing protein [Rhizomicrobium sp.]